MSRRHLPTIPTVVAGALAVTVAVVAVGCRAEVAPVVTDPVPAVADPPTTDEPVVIIEAEGIVDYEPVVVATHPHDPEAFTQGLEFVDGLLLESTGLVGRSTLRLVEPTTGDVIQRVEVAEPLFAEGATVVGDEVWQLTWQDETALLYQLDGLVEQRRVAYRGEGWGLCLDSNREQLIMSDGSDRLTFRDPTTFEPLGSVPVTDDDGPVSLLNELECVDGTVWANVWQTTRIVAIDPGSGTVVGEIDVGPLVPDGLGDPDGAVANGIAFDPGTGRFWLTGKLWPVIYEIELKPRP